MGKMLQNQKPQDRRCAGGQGSPLPVCQQPCRVQGGADARKPLKPTALGLVALNWLRRLLSRDLAAFLTECCCLWYMVSCSFLYIWDWEAFSVRPKQFWPLDKARSVLEKMIPSLSHESDGLILQVGTACADRQGKAMEATCNIGGVGVETGTPCVRPGCGTGAGAQPLDGCAAAEQSRPCDVSCCEGQKAACHPYPHWHDPCLCWVAWAGFLQPFDDPYIPRTYPHLLKWKFPHMNSVDFKLDAKPSEPT